MLEGFKKYLFSACGCDPMKHFLLTVSGGIDSVVMAHLFKSSQLSFSIAHCNFQLRKEESEKDQRFVEVLAAYMGVECHIKKFETALIADNKGISIQMAARELRYNWFEELSNSLGYEYIAVGHNKNDIVETMLLNLSRGTGIRGLMGIRPVHHKIIRPLLFASREEIAKYAVDHKLEWREDSSNKETKYYRNKIRHDIIPAFEEINPSFLQSAIDTIQRIEKTGKLLDHFLKLVKDEVWQELPDRVLINMQMLNKYPSGDILLFELLKDFGVTQLSEKMLFNTLGSDSGKQLHTHSHTITRDRDHLIIIAKKSHPVDEILIGPEISILDHPIGLSFKVIETNHEFLIPKERNSAAFDADKISFPLLLRGWKKGDRFHPLGLQGSKKISDFLINIKLPVPDKENLWILESEGKIIWVVNHRIDDRFKVTGTTHKILLIVFKES